MELGAGALLAASAQRAACSPRTTPSSQRKAPSATSCRRRQGRARQQHHQLQFWFVADIIEKVRGQGVDRVEWRLALLRPGQFG